MTYSVVESLPSPETYCSLRIECGLTFRSLESAKTALPKSIYGVSVMHQDTVIGMGRIMGDDCFWYVVDICILPAHQKQGLGKLIMTKLGAFITSNVPKGCDVVLLAVKDAKYLYEQFGFQSTAPMGTIAMRLVR
jgi:GNAT superfamily N-acetyltransferase